MLEAIADLYQQFLSGLPEPAALLIDFVVTLFPKLLEGAFVSIQLLLLSGVVGNLLALPVALARFRGIRRCAFPAISSSC